MISPQVKQAVADYLDNRAITRPQRLPNFLEADLPPAEMWRFCAVIVSDLDIIAHSNGSDWIRSDTGAAI